MKSKYAAMVRQIVQVRSVFGWTGALLFAGVIAGCAVTPPATINTVEARAKRLEAGGSYGQAATVWAQLATSSQGAMQAVALLSAAEDYEKAGDLAAAWTVAAGLSIPVLPAARQAEGALTVARLALETHRPQQALKALALAPQLQGNKDLQTQWLSLAGRAHFDAGEPAAGLQALIKRGALLAIEPQKSLTNSEMLWEYLKASPQIPSATGFGTVGQGWIALAQIWRTAWEEPKQFSSQLSDWQALYPNHPAMQGLIAEITAEEKARLSYPARVALLLPLSGPNAAQAQAVQAGILAAYYQGHDTQPAISVYDTTGSASGARQALAKARAAGAQFVLGPLTVAGVQGAVSDQSGIPELALNYLPGNNTMLPGNFFQFGLSPEQEARTSAEQAVAQGLSRAVVIVPDNDWGSRIAAAFTKNLTDLGGRVLASATIRTDSQEFGAALSSVFGLDASTEREQRLATVLGQPLGFTPRRRQDIQFVFFAAPYATAQLVPPQIDYYHGLGLPIYSISNVYRPGANTPDMNGVYFPAMPWFLNADAAMATTRKQLSHLYPQHWQQFAPLYALGYDAWRLLPLLMNSPKPLVQPVRGVSGSLSMGQRNVIQRRADPAQYVNGTAAPVQATAQ